MADDYTPSDVDIQHYYTVAMARLSIDGWTAFERWRARHDAQVKAEALREAVESALVEPFPFNIARLPRVREWAAEGARFIAETVRRRADRYEKEAGL